MIEGQQDCFRLYLEGKGEIISPFHEKMTLFFRNQQELISTVEEDFHSPTLFPLFLTQKKKKKKIPQHCLLL